MTYDDWLQMTDDEREVAHRSWNTYERENVWVPTMAAARLAMNSDTPVTEISVGVYHGGEYLLRMMVRRSDIGKCPPFLSQTFEGFRVAWLHPPGPPDDLREHPLFGSWMSAGGSGDYQIDIGVEDGQLAINCRTSPGDEPLAVEMASCTEDAVEFFTTHNGVGQRHGLVKEYDRDHPNRMQHAITTHQYGYLRARAQ